MTAASLRVAFRPVIDDGAARARRTRDPGTPCARHLDPAGTHARPATSGRDARGEAGESTTREATSATRGEPRVVVRPEIDDGAARARRTREQDASCARLPDPDGMSARAPPATNASNLRAGSGSACASAVVIPAEVVLNAVALAREKVTSENRTRAELLQGAYLRDVYAKYGVM